MTLEDWMFAWTFIAAAFLVASAVIFAVDMVYDKLTGRRK